MTVVANRPHIGPASERASDTRSRRSHLPAALANEIRAVRSPVTASVSRMCKRKHYEVYTPLEKVVVHEIYRARFAINTVLIKCETDKLSDKTR